jgi:predicted ribonuclease YlaK
VLLEYLPPAEIPWTEIVRQDSVRLILPLRVIEELDAKKYSRRKSLSNRARRLLPQLAKVIGSSGEPGDLRPGVTIEVTVDPGPRLRPEDADEEVLAACAELRQFSATEITLISADTAMRLRAGALQIPVMEMPNQYLRQSDSEEG